ncbi:hypothetical protein LINPERHAP1_LOCUS38002 [Linum perenne]
MCGQVSEFINFGFTGPHFTWFRRALYIVDLSPKSWIRAFSSSTVRHLPRLKLDHRPIFGLCGGDSATPVFATDFSVLGYLVNPRGFSMVTSSILGI